ncbi:Lrp/AsnC family transcriptional regulator [Paenirhodobacter ferrireducens]|nr:Lrp/AsnC family transcriptional regulator [Sinirhodobacter ferrireducens]
MRDLDRLDIAILEALQDNARTPLSEVGRRVGLSQPATSERVKRLEDRGIITGYAVRLDPAALGLGMMAIIRLKTSHEHIKPALRAFAEMPHVIEVHRLTGEDCFLLKVLVPTPGQLETIVDAIARFGAITTSLVLHSAPVKPLGKALLG